MKRTLIVLFASLLTSGCATAQIQPHERVIFFPAVGTPTDDGAFWKAEVRGWIFDPRRNTELQKKFLEAVLELAHAVPESLTEDQRRNFDQRSARFFVDSERGRRLSLRIGAESYPLEDCRDALTDPGVASGGDGLFRGCLLLDASKIAGLQKGGAIRFEAANPAAASPVFDGTLYLTQPSGVVVVSDIDDTIKITEVHDRPTMLRRTFYLNFEAVPKMADVYNAWARSARPSFHVYYVSASPWQLYEPLASFLQTSGFPPGIFHLKPFRFKNPEEFLRFFTERPDEYKERVIAPVLERFRKRCFVLVGDSGERDPEAYGELGRRYPDQVARIFIRDLKNEGRTAPRYLEAFKYVPAAVWDVFADPSTIRDALPVTCKAGQG